MSLSFIKCAYQVLLVSACYNGLQVTGMKNGCSYTGHVTQFRCDNDNFWKPEVALPSVSLLD